VKQLTEIAPLFKADSATLSFYATKEGKISVSYQGWDQSKTVLAGQQFVVTWGQGHVEARIVERRQRRLAAWSLGGGPGLPDGGVATPVLGQVAILLPRRSLFRGLA
jgi:hypothetical protein